MVDQAYQSIPKPVAAYTPTEVSLCDFLVCIFCLDSQENGLEDKSDPSGKSVQKARWIVATKESPMVTWCSQDPMENKKCLVLHMQQDTAWEFLLQPSAAWFCFG